MPDQERPVVAITIGDPAGIGPEVVLKALGNPEIYRICRPLVVGESQILEETLKVIKKSLIIRSIKKASDVKGEYGTIDLLDLQNLDQSNVRPGKVSGECGKAAMEFIDKAMDLTLKHETAALVTAPINKEATLLAGYAGLGHLEYIARATGSKNYATMLVSGNLRCVHLTTHLSLREACNYVRRDRILERLKLTHDSFRQWGFESPRIGVAGLNPHAGEEGMFGREEIEEIAPAVREAVKSGIKASGPFPADSIFNRAMKGEFEAVLVMYHDQGHIAIKVHGFEKSVSIALGLPVLRTSVDHGTAFDIAGKGIASGESMEEAIKTAVYLSERKYFG